MYFFLTREIKQFAFCFTYFFIKYYLNIEVVFRIDIFKGIFNFNDCLKKLTKHKQYY